MPGLEKPLTPLVAATRKLTFARSVVAYFRLWRYSASGIVVCFLSMYLGWIALAGGFHLERAAAVVSLAIVAATCILLAVFLINDAADREIDKVVHPERPIPRGLAAWEHIATFGAILLSVGVGLALFVSLRFAAVSALLAGCVALYYGYLKRRLRFPFFSDVITPMISALFPLSAFAVSPQCHLELLLAVISFIYLADLAHDLIGGVHDREGDRRLNVSTLALAIGDKSTLLISFISFLLSVAAGLLVHIWGELGWLYLAALGIMSTVMMYHYVDLLRTGGNELELAARKANHLGGFYFFIVSGSVLPDYMIRHLHG